MAERFNGTRDEDVDAIFTKLETAIEDVDFEDIVQDLEVAIDAAMKTALRRLAALEARRRADDVPPDGSAPARE